MRPLLLPGLLDAARHNAAHGAGRPRAVRVGPHLPPGRRPGRARGQPARRDARHRAPPHRRACSPSARPPPGARPPRRPTSTPPRAWWRRSPRPRGWTWRWPPATRPFLHPGRSADRGRRRPRGGLDRRAAPAGGAGVGPRRRGRLRAGRRRAGRGGRPGSPGFRDVTSFPAVLQDIAVVVPLGVSADEVRAAVREGGGELLASAEVFDVYTRRAGRRGQPLARAAAAVPGARPHAHRRRGGRAAHGDRGGGGAASEGGCVAEPTLQVAGARARPGFGGGAVRVDRGTPSRRWSSPRSPRGRTPARATATSTPATGSTWSCRSPTPIAWPSAPDRRWWPTRTRRPPWP